MRESKNNFKSDSFQNLDEADKFLENPNLSKPTQEERANQNGSNTTGKFGWTVRNLLKKKKKNQDGFFGEFYWRIKEEIITIYRNYLSEQKRKGEYKNGKLWAKFLSLPSILYLPPPSLLLSPSLCFLVCTMHKHSQQIKSRIIFK